MNKSQEKHGQGQEASQHLLPLWAIAMDLAQSILKVKERFLSTKAICLR
jgi:hypothetical protein